MKKLFWGGLLALAGLSSAYAQVEISYVVTTGHDVSNEGLVVGPTTQSENDMNAPYGIWNPDDGSERIIGGISAGNGIGGVARFLHDGLVAAVALDSMAQPAAWDTVVFGSEEIPFIYDMIFQAGNQWGFVAGEVEATDTIFGWTSANAGQTWRDYRGNIYVDRNGGFRVCTNMDEYNVMAGGENGILYYGWLSGGNWRPVTPFPDKDVKTYTAMAFIPFYPSPAGLVGGELADGTPFLWRTTDAAVSFDSIVEVPGLPTSLVQVDGDFFLSTRNGFLSRSLDSGRTWQQVFSTEGKALNEIAFLNRNTGIAVGDSCVYFTLDGGDTWIEKAVEETGIWNKSGKSAQVMWNDVIWAGNTAIVAGSDGNLWRSVDSVCSAWTKLFYPGAGDIYAVAVSQTGHLHIGGEDGHLYRRILDEESVVMEEEGMASLYNIATDTWTALPTFGIYQDWSATNTYGASDDGSAVVGSAAIMEWNGNREIVNSHATVWQNGGIYDLGTLFPGEYTRASAASYDGSVIVGHQDKLGPWMGCYWTRNEDSTYSEPQLLFPDGVAFEDVDFDNFDDVMAKTVGQAKAVSADGKWIGGTGDNWTAYSSIWLYNREKNEYVFLSGSTGSVSAMNNDATVVVGFDGSGWIWTPQDGKMEINAFVREKLNVQMEDGLFLSNVLNMSENGRYICGWGVTADYRHFGYRVDLKDWLEARNEETGWVEVAVYPNPVAEELHVDLLGGNLTRLRLFDLQGRMVREMTTTSASNVMEVSDLEPGIYFLQVEEQGRSRSVKVIVR